MCRLAFGHAWRGVPTGIPPSCVYLPSWHCSAMRRRKNFGLCGFSLRGVRVALCRHDFAGLCGPGLCGPPSWLRRPVWPRPSWPACVSGDQYNLCAFVASLACVAPAFVASLCGSVRHVGLCGLGLRDQPAWLRAFHALQVHLVRQLLSRKSQITYWSSRAST